LHGDVEFVTSDHEDKPLADRLDYRVTFSLQQGESFENMRRAAEQRIKEERGGLAEVPVEQERSESAQTPASLPAAFNTTKPATYSSSSTKAATPSSNTPTSKVAGGPEILNKKLCKLAEQHKSEDENIEFCLVSTHVIGGWHQAIVALKERLLVIKPGMVAGATFGARVTSFYYRDITGIEVNTGLISGVIEINTPAYQGTKQKDFWNVKDDDKNPFRVTNCLPVDRFELKEYKPYIDRLRKMIREAKQDRVIQQPSPSGSNLASEFQQAKRRLLG
jgi:hypothetical protein